MKLVDRNGLRRVEVLPDMCVGCNLCSLVCPVQGCIEMKRINDAPPATWKEVSAGKGAIAPRPQHYTYVSDDAE